MPFTFSAKKVLIDSSVFFHFCEGGQIISLRGYLDKRAYIVLEVDEELQRNSATFRDLKTLELMRWPPEEHKLELPAELKRELLDILRAWRKPGDHPLKNAGEVATVLMAQRLGGFVVLDDAQGKTLADQRGVPRASTPMLAAEMVVVGYVEEPQGFAVYDAATPDGIGQPEWQALLVRAHAAKP